MLRNQGDSSYMLCKSGLGPDIRFLHAVEGASQGGMHFFLFEKSLVYQFSSPMHHSVPWIIYCPAAKQPGRPTLKPGQSYWRKCSALATSITLLTSAPVQSKAGLICKQRPPYQPTWAIWPISQNFSIGEQCCQVAVSVARFYQTWLFCDPLAILFYFWLQVKVWLVPGYLERRP